MKIGYFTPSYFDEGSVLGGGERYPHALAKGVVEASGGACSVELVSYGTRAFRRELSPGVSLRVLPATVRPDGPLDAVSWEIPRAVADFDLIHAHQVYTRSTEAVAICARQLGKALAFTDHGGWFSELGHQNELLELADRLICYSDFGASLFRTKRPIEVVKGGVDTDYFTPPPHPPRRGHVLYVGRLLPHKGIDQLIRAIPADIPLKICGRPYFPQYFDHLKWLAEGKAVEFVTTADDDAIRELYRNAWANVLPSVYRDCYGNDHLLPELMGFTLIEALACGTPAVCTRVGGMPEFVRQGETGYVVDSAEMLTETLARLASDPAEVERLGRRGREVVVAEFSQARVGEKLLAIYRAMLRDRRAEAA